MTTPLFQAQSFPVKGSKKIACLITGYRGKITGYESVIKALNERGFTVIGYEYSSSVLTNCDPPEVMSLLDGIYNDFAARAKGYKKIICTGASAGAGLCLALQKRMPAMQYGVYAGAGEPGEDVIERPLFYLARKKFSKNGFDAEKVKSFLQELDITPSKPPRQHLPFVIVLGKRDKFVRYQKALAALQSWQQAGVPINIITRPDLGHMGVIAWYKEHIGELLDDAERLGHAGLVGNRKAGVA